MTRRIGAHLPLGGGMVRAVDRAREIGATTLQVFADNPTAWRRRAGPPKEAPAFRRRLGEAGIRPVAVHAPYLVNLAGPDEDFFERSVAVLIHELAIAPAFGARFVNVHVGSHRGSGVIAGTARVADGLARVLAGDGGADSTDDADRAAAMAGRGPTDEPTIPDRRETINASPEEGHRDPPILVLENSAGGGAGLGATVEELADILEAATARGADAERLAFCLDTAHAWGAGYAISDPAQVDSLVERFDRLIGLRRLSMVHLNDSRSARGSNADRHEHIGAGDIGPRGLGRILTHPGLVHVAYILETPGMDEGFDALNMARALALTRGEDLPELPDHARHARGSRSRTPPDTNAD